HTRFSRDWSSDVCSSDLSIPGIGVPTADIVIAETGADMARFPTPGHLASWAGVCPGHNESAGKSRSTKARPGNRHLKGALGASEIGRASCREEVTTMTSD